MPRRPDTFSGIGGEYRRETPDGPRICVSQGTMPSADAERNLEGTVAKFLDEETTVADDETETGED